MLLSSPSVCTTAHHLGQVCLFPGTILPWLCNHYINEGSHPPWSSYHVLVTCLTSLNHLNSPMWPALSLARISYMRHLRRREGASLPGVTQEVSGGAVLQFSPSAFGAPNSPSCHSGNWIFLWGRQKHAGDWETWCIFSELKDRHQARAQGPGPFD